MDFLFIIGIILMAFVVLVGTSLIMERARSKSLYERIVAVALTGFIFAVAFNASLRIHGMSQISNATLAAANRQVETISFNTWTGYYRIEENIKAFKKIEGELRLDEGELAMVFERKNESFLLPVAHHRIFLAQGADGPFALYHLSDGQWKTATDEERTTFERYVDETLTHLSTRASTK